MKLSSDGKRTIYATWLGGTLSETPWDIAVGADGSAYIVGETTSEDFPVTPGAAQPAPGGTVNLGPLSFGDGFAARLDPAGQRLIYGTYLGGKGGDALLAIAIDPNSGNAFVAGKTEDANTQMMPGARTDAMFAILSATGTLIRKARAGNPETPEWGISASISPDGHYFSGLYLSNEVLELSPETLEPIRRANLRTATAPAIFALPGGLVEVAAPGGSLKTNIFLVPAGKPAIGALYLAQYDFRRASQPAVTAIVNAASYLQGRQFGGGDISLVGQRDLYDLRRTAAIAGTSIARWTRTADPVCRRDADQHSRAKRYPTRLKRDRY